MSWIQTYSGQKFDFIDITPESIRILDIAVHLSLINRYLGATGHGYSVAQHSWVMCCLAPAELKFQALMHDAAEAYIGDIVAPMKYMPWMEPLRSLEDRIMRAIAERYDIIYPFDDYIHTLDLTLMNAERYEYLAAPPANWGRGEPEPLLDWYHHMLHPMEPQKARTLFLQAFLAYAPHIPSEDEPDTWHRPRLYREDKEERT